MGGAPQTADKALKALKIGLLSDITAFQYRFIVYNKFGK
jgi:hypothetical protein